MLVTAQGTDVAAAQEACFELEDDRWFAQPERLADLVVFLQPGAQTARPPEPEVAYAAEAYSDVPPASASWPEAAASSPPEAPAAELPPGWVEAFDESYNMT